MRSANRKINTQTPLKWCVLSLCAVPSLAVCASAQSTTTDVPVQMATTAKSSSVPNGDFEQLTTDGKLASWQLPANAQVIAGKREIILCVSVSRTLAMPG
jgi:hypothetical protein